jgi:hypothetical protein
VGPTRRHLLGRGKYKGHESFHILVPAWNRDWRATWDKRANV